MRAACLFLLAGLLGAMPVAAASKNPEIVTVPCPQKRKLNDEKRFQAFVIRTYRGDHPDVDFNDCIQVLRHQRVVFSEAAEGRITIGNDINGGFEQEKGAYQPPAVPLGRDITGLGKPNLIFSVWSGGAHCCYTFHILELGDRVREIAKVDAADSDYAHFEDVNKDGIYEFVGWDFTFAYWHAGFNGSPAPVIVLRFNGAGYELAPDLMRKPAPSAEELGKKREKVRHADWTDGYPPPLLWGTMLNLIYTGHSELAWRFVSDAWMPVRTPKKTFLRDFCGQLARSPYFDELRPTIVDAPCEFNPKYGEQSD